MNTLTIKINGNTVECGAEDTILRAADAAGIYIPRMCYHPDLPPLREVVWADDIFQSDIRLTGDHPGEKAGEEAPCNLCLVEVEGVAEPVNSCARLVEPGMVVRTDTPEVITRRKQALAKLLADHPHACLTCAQQEGCSRTSCSTNVPENERCCVLLGRCELQKVSEFIGIPGDTVKYIPQQRPKTKNDPLFDRDFNLCIGCLRCVRVCRDLRGADVLGAVWKDGRAWVGTRAGAGLQEAECRFCGACVEVCPTGALRDKDGVPAVRRDAPLPCVGECPAGIDIPGYVRLIAQGRYDDALEVIRSRAPFPGILGYVCFHPCESICRRSEVDQPVAICALKRFAADNAASGDLGAVSRKSDTGKKVAIIGAGPAGLTAAYYLGAQGHQVDLFDEGKEPGGMLRHAIPDYRLPPEVLERELKVLNEAGVNMHMNTRLGAEFGIHDLRTQGYDAILIAAGTPLSKSLPIENSDLAGIYPGLEFLKSAKLSREPRMDGRVVVIGGGNVAIDAAMSAVRLGASEVHLVCLESRDEMPAHGWEIAQAVEEGITIHPSWGPIRFTSGNGWVSGVDLKRCTRVFDEQGRFAPEYDENETRHLDADSVIVTIGQEVNREMFSKFENLKSGPGGTITTNDSFGIGLEGMFAAGDIVRGPSSVVKAIADGRRAADAIDRYLGGSGLADTTARPADLDSRRLDASFEEFRQTRQAPVTANPASRKSGFSLIEETLSESAAHTEAMRCLQCHLRQTITSVVLPPELWLAFCEEAVQLVPDTDGVFQLLNEEKKILRITGTANLRQGLAACLENPGEAKYFVWEEDPMYTKRESELIQQYLQEHGEMPGGAGGDDLDDLF